MAMTDMAKTPSDVKEEQSDWGTAQIAGAVDKYDWGLRISLDSDSLKKLGLDGNLPPIGSVVEFTAKARVTSASSSEREKADGSSTEHKSVDLQITHMDIPSAAPVERARDWYSKPEKTDG